jgi:transcriptional regulator with XRE-family HTH domain
MKFGDYLRKKREDRGWTQPQAAAKAEIEQSYLSKLETGKSYPSEDVFPRLVAAFEIDLSDMMRAVGSSELSKLREIGEVRIAILDRQRTQRTFARGWLIAMLACLMIGGACLGLTQLAVDTTRSERNYKSMGVLRPDEPLDVFDLVDRPLSTDGPDYQTLRETQQNLIDRLDVVTRLSDTERGPWFVENVPEGRRVFRFDLMGSREITTPSPLRWFIVPAFGLLIGSLGCAFASMRWS